MGLFLLSDPSTFLTFISLSNFFDLNPCFLMNSELITNPVTLLSNNASTVTLSYVSILSSPIFTVTSLNNFLSTFLTLSSFSSDLGVSVFISVANILYLF